MAELLPQERLLPFLLDRITDEEPQQKQESRDRRVISTRQLRQSILRDLSWLLNARSQPEVSGVDEFPEAAKSVLNYGMPQVTGKTNSTLTAQQVEKMVKVAIQAYEPRIIRNTLSVRVVEGHNSGGCTLSLEIRGQVWAQPLPESLYVKTEVDLECGLCQLQDQLHG